MTFIIDEKIFLQRIQDHMTRIVNASPEHVAFLENHLSNEITKTLSSMAAKKMGLTQVDNKVHSFAMTNESIGYCVYAIPVLLENGSQWFSDEYSGYLELLNRLPLHPAISAVNPNALVHFVFGLGSGSDDLWFNMSIVPIDSVVFSFQPILAIDLLSDAEKQRIGII